MSPEASVFFMHLFFPIHIKKRWRHPSSIGFFLLTIIFVTGQVQAGQPIIDFFLADPMVILPNDIVTLTLQAHDPDCNETCTSGCGQTIREDLTQWDASSGSFESIDNGISSSPYSASAIWRAPSSEGNVIITVILYDNGGMLCGGRQTVSRELVVQVSETAGQEPIITSMSISGDPVLVGESAFLSVTAEDPQGDPVTFTWSAAFGSVTVEEKASANYTAPAIPVLDTITCSVSDPGGATTSQTMNVKITSALPASVITGDLITPHDLAINRWGDLVVADQTIGGLTFINATTRETLQFIEVPQITCVAIDWLDRLIVGTRTGTFFLSNSGLNLGSLLPDVPLGAPADISIDPDGLRIWVLYGSSGRLIAYDESGSIVESFGQRGDGPGDFSEPVAISWSPSGEIMIADEDLGQILVFDQTGTFMRTISSFGSDEGELTRVSALAVGPDHTLYVSDAFQSRLQVFDEQGNFLESLGGYGSQAGQFQTPMGLMVLPTPPRLAVCSANSSSIQVLRLDTNQVAIPQANVDPEMINFGEILFGQISSPATVQLTNTGSVPISIYGVHTPDAFEVQTTCLDGLAPGETCTATVIFNPIRVGRLTGSLRFNCSGQGEQEVTLQATVIPIQPPVASSSQDEIIFDPLFTGMSSEIKTLTLTNIGGSLLNITSIEIHGEDASQFALATDSCTGQELGAGETCFVNMYFTPDFPGMHEAEITIHSSSSNGPVSVRLSGQAMQRAEVPTLNQRGIVGMILGLALMGLIFIRRRHLPLVILLIVPLSGDWAHGTDPPHRFFGIECASCHTNHNAVGGVLTAAESNSNLCLSCHTAGGRAANLPILPSHTLSTHHYNVTPNASRWGSQMPENPEMANRIMDGLLVCSTCHDSHSAEAANRGRLRISALECITSFGSTGSIDVGGTFTGTNGSSYLIEITIADNHFRYSKDGGSSWIAEADIGTDIVLDNGLTVTFSNGSFSLGERWRFTASFPFLRIPLDQGDNVTGDRFCRECHSLWIMDHNDMEVFSSRFLSHPIGVPLGINGRGYDRAVPLDGNGADQGSVGADGNSSNDYKLDEENLVQCMSCHGIHYADSNTLTEDKK